MMLKTHTNVCKKLSYLKQKILLQRRLGSVVKRVRSSRSFSIRNSVNWFIFFASRFRWTCCRKKPWKLRTKSWWRPFNINRWSCRKFATVGELADGEEDQHDQQKWGFQRMDSHNICKFISRIFVSFFEGIKRGRRSIYIVVIYMEDERWENVLLWHQEANIGHMMSWND